jgi:DNA transformation protein and related proteins
MASATNPAANEFARHCIELCSSIGSARSRRMFGGHGIYVDDLFVAIIIGERLYLKVDDLTRARFTAEGCTPFVYDAKGKAVSLGYFSAPDNAIESPALMQPWARLAFEAALRARAAKAVSVRRKARAVPPKTSDSAKSSAPPQAAARPRKATRRAT